MTIFCKYDLIKEMEENPSLIDLVEVKHYLKDEEITVDKFADQFCENVNDSVEMVMESAWESFYESIDRWYSNMDYVNHEYPSCVDSEEFAKLVLRRVRKEAKHRQTGRF